MPPSENCGPRQVVNQRFGSFELRGPFREDIHVQVGIADVAEDDVLAGEFAIQFPAIDGQHLADRAISTAKSVQS